MNVGELSLESNLKKHFGFDKFRGNQKEVIENLLAGKDTFVIMPTGAGKSLCYQLPATILEGTALVVSPLIALMKNQVDQLNAHGITASFLNSSLNKTTINEIKKDLLNGKIKLLYVAPESLTKEENIELFKKTKISFVAVDEVHCISEWGHDFRPEYRRIKHILAEISQVPIIALTATATPKVQQDIQKNLQMEDASVFKTSFRRKNLFYEILPKISPKTKIVEFIKSHPNEAGIIYCLSRKKVEEITEFLTVNGIQALAYHAGMENKQRIQHQDAFLNEDANIIVATIAFGMGIDKPDVRFVIHYDAPKSLEGYYQETGRAGRDSRNSHCILFYSYNDVLKLEKFFKDKPIAERDTNKLLLDEVVSFSETALCRTKQLLHYFGEHQEEDCGFCDNCKNPKETFNAKNKLLTALKICEGVKENFGLKHMVDVAVGATTQTVKNYEHNQLPEYGIGKADDKQIWISIYRQALLGEFLEKNIDQYGVVNLTDKGRDYINKPFDINFFKDHEYPNVLDDSVEAFDHHHHDVVNEELLAILKNLRKTVSNQKKIPPYVIFQDESLEEMATTYPISIQDLTHIQGVGIGKANKYGKPFLEAIKKFTTENGIESIHETLVKSSVNKSKNKVYIIQQVDKQVPFQLIADSLSITYLELLEEIEHICHSGTKLDVSYEVEQEVDEESEDDIYNYFMEVEKDDMEEAVEELGEEYTEEEIKLIHIKFISELAN